MMIRMGKKTSVHLSEDEEILVRLLKRKLGQVTKTGVLRQCLYLVAEQKGIDIEMSERSRPDRNGGQTP